MRRKSEARSAGVRAKREPSFARGVIRRRLAGFFRSFRFAGRGIVHAVRQERNLRFDLCVAVYVGLLSLFYDFGPLQYAVLAVAVFGVLAMETLNSAVERAVDYTGTEKNERARVAKDVAAGAVLMFCVGAVAVGVALFWNLEVLAGVAAWFAARPAVLVLLALSLVASFWFVFIFGGKGEK